MNNLKSIKIRFFRRDILQKQSGNYIAMGHSLFIPEDKDRSNIFMHGHFCLRIENIFDDDDEEVTKSRIFYID